MDNEKKFSLARFKKWVPSEHPWTETFDYMLDDNEPLNDCSNFIVTYNTDKSIFTITGWD